MLKEQEAFNKYLLMISRVLKSQRSSKIADNILRKIYKNLQN